MDKKAREKRIREIVSREYKIFKEEERLATIPRTLYEKACNVSERIIRVKPDKKAREKLQYAIDFAHLKTTPGGAVSLTFLFMLVVLLPTLLLMATYMVFHQERQGIVVSELIMWGLAEDRSVIGFSGVPFGYGAMVVLIGIFLTYYLYFYPLRLKSRYEMLVGSDIVTAVLYIVMYMRNNPSLEGAVRFASENIPDELGLELKKMLWDVEIGNFLSMEEALIDYTKKWSKNRPFVESIQLLITSLRQVGERRITMLEEAVNIILEGNREQARHFNQKLKLPVSIVHALGIILPVMGLVLFPIVAVFLNVDATILFVGYDIILPFILYFTITSILEIRPSTFSKINISENPDVPPKGMFKFGEKFAKAWPIALLSGLITVALGVFLYFAELSEGESFEGIIPAVVIAFGFAFGFAIYFILVSKQKLKLREETRRIENEFAEALFQLGNQISGGVPLELSIENSMERIKNLSIRNLFEKALKNMKMLGFTFSQAFFDEKYGAIRYYPSKLIKSVMRTVVEASKKGVAVASNAMLSVSRYLKDLHQTQEEVKDSLNDTLSSLKFQAYFLTPMISGVVATLAIIIIRILKQLGEQSAAFGGGIPLLAQFGQIAITPFQFIMIVSVYMIETSFILGMFINSIENGEDPIGRQNITGYTLLIGFAVFAASLFITLTLFGPLIAAAI